MVLVRLASRVVIGASDRATDVAATIADLSKNGVRAVDVSVLGKAETYESTVSPSRARGVVGAVGKVANWLHAPRKVSITELGDLVGAGVLVEVLAASPNTSPVGALVMQGVPQRDALAIADLLTRGKIIILVGVADRVMGERVRAILIRHCGSSVGYFSGRPYGTAFHGTGPGLR